MPSSPLYFQLPISWREQRDRSFYVERCNLRWANEWIQRLHYRHQRVHDLGYPFAYSIHHAATGAIAGVAIFAVPHFTRLKGMFGYPGLPTKWQVLLLSRLWIEPAFQQQVVTDSRGQQHSLCVASCAIAQMSHRINQDWLAWHPPPFPEQPYNLRLLISYADLNHQHVGTVYQASNFSFGAATVSDKVSRHSPVRRVAPLPLLRYFLPLRRVFDPLQQQYVRHDVPRGWSDLHKSSKERLSEALSNAL